MNPIITAAIGFCLQLGGFIDAVLSSSSTEGPGILVSWLGTGLLVFGCGGYAAEKGRSRAFGLLGLLSIPGFFVLALLKENPASLKLHNRKDASPSDPGN